MRRVLFTWRGRCVWSYPAFLFIGLNAGIVAQNCAAHIARLDSFWVFVATFLLLPLALIGSRVLFVAAEWRVYAAAPRRIWQRSDGGMSMYGAVPLMLASSVPVLRWLALPFWKFWDVSTFCILTGMFFTRIGCLLNGCCAGRSSDSPLAICLLDSHGERRRIPTQLLEAVFALALLVAASATWGRLRMPGLLFLAVLATYAAGRVPLQAMRAERERLGRIDIQQAISVALLIFSLSGLALLSGFGGPR